MPVLMKQQSTDQSVHAVGLAFRHEHQELDIEMLQNGCLLGSGRVGSEPMPLGTDNKETYLSFRNATGIGL